MENPEKILPILYDGGLDVTATNGDQYLPFDGRWYPCPFFKELGGRDDDDNFATSPWDENGGTEETYEREGLTYDNGNGNWLRECSSVFGDCWGCDFISPGNEIDHSDCRGAWKTRNGEEERLDGHFSCHEDTENHTAGEYNSWSCCDSWFPNGEENDRYNDGGEEAEATNGHGLREIEVCEGIFGYWPCLYR